MALSFRDWFRGLSKTKIPAFNWFFSLRGNNFTFKKLDDRSAIESGYMGNLNVYAIIKKASEGVATLPYVIEKKNGQEWEQVSAEDNEVANFFFNPNKDQTIIDLLEQQMVYYFTTGEAYFISETEAIGFNGERVVGVPSEIMSVKLVDDQDYMSEIAAYKMETGRGQKKLDPSEVCHLRMFNPSIEGFKSRDGLSPLQAAYYKLNASNNQAVGQSEYFENRGISSIISPNAQAAANGMTLLKKDKEQIDQAFRSRVGGAQKVNGAITTTSPVTVQQLGTSASDMQMLEQGSQFLRELCNAIFMPSEMFNDPDNKTHANRKEAVKTMYNDVFLPNAMRFMRAYEKKIIKPYGLRADGGEYRIRVDKDKIEALKVDPFEKKKMLLEEVRSGVITRNEYRAMCEREELPIEGMDRPTVQNQVNQVNPENA